MFTDSNDQRSLDDANLARTHPEAYEAKMKAEAGINPMRDIINFFKRLFVKKAK